MKSSTLMAIVVLALLIAGGIFYFRDTAAPQVTLQPQAGPVAPDTTLTLEVADPGSQLKELVVEIRQPDRQTTLLSRTPDPGTETLRESFTLADQGLEDGPVTVRVRATDRAIYHFGAGNAAEKTFELDYDATPPVVSVLSKAHNLNRGGTGLIVYRVSEETRRSGMQVGKRFFPGYQLPSGDYACFFALPYSMEPEAFEPRLIAIDRAGNERPGGFYYHVNDRDFPEVEIRVSDRFLQAKMPAFSSRYPEVTDPLELFLKVNGELRQENRDALAEIGRETASRPLWDGPFRRQPNTATRGEFAANRAYYHDGKVVDRQTHLGVDLASVAQAPVWAANDGRVVYADYLGIYGQCVVIDHGLGLQSLYGHLSRIEVEAGDEVAKGDTIARSGATGLAGGDHLHFAVLVSGLPVNPIEWWDPNWVRNNVTAKLEGGE